MQKKFDFCRADFQDGKEQVICYRTGKAVYEERFADGMLAAAGYNFAGYPLNVLSNVPSRLERKYFWEASAFHLEVDGSNVDFGLKLEDFTQEKTETGVHAVLSLLSEIKPIRIRVHTILDGTCSLTRYLEVENLSDVPVSISKLSVLSGGMETLEKNQLEIKCPVNEIYSLGYFDETSWGCEGDFAWHPLEPAVTAIDTRFRRVRFRHPLVFLKNRMTGQIWSIQTEWSGGCRFSFDYEAKKTSPDFKTHLTFEAEITGYTPLYRLGGGETMETPAVHIGVVHGDLDDAILDMHAHIRRSVLCGEEIDPSEALIGCGMGAEHDMSMETSKAFARQMKEMGGELFLVDAGWQCPPGEEMQWFAYNGIYEPDKDRYPNGLLELSDYCHSIGMKFGIWTEIERVGKMSPLHQEKAEWRSSDIYGNPSEGGYLDFSNPEVEAWAEETLAKLITDYKLDLLRVDYNIRGEDYFAMRDMGTGAKECISMKHFQAVYRVYRNLKKRFPQVIFENCAGGGGRTDLGIMKGFHHTWVSDWQRMPRSITITNGMTMALPPERVDRLFAGMGCHTFGAVASHMRNTMLTHMSLNVIAPAILEANPEVMDFIRHSTDLYKTFIRPMLPTSKIYHHTPEVGVEQEHRTTILELAAPDGERGVVAVFALAEDGASCRIKCKGASAQKQYKVTLDNSGESFTMGGAQLKLEGLPIQVGSAMGSELILYQEI